MVYDGLGLDLIQQIGVCKSADANERSRRAMTGEKLKQLFRESSVVGIQANDVMSHVDDICRRRTDRCEASADVFQCNGDLLLEGFAKLTIFIDSNLARKGYESDGGRNSRGLDVGVCRPGIVDGRRIDEFGRHFQGWFGDEFGGRSLGFRTSRFQRQLYRLLY